MEWQMMTATDKQLREWASTETEAAVFARLEISRRAGRTNG